MPSTTLLMESLAGPPFGERHSTLLRELCNERAVLTIGGLQRLLHLRDHLHLLRHLEAHPFQRVEILR